MEYKGRHKKKTVFFQKNSERGGGGSRRIRNFLIRKNWDFFGIFFERGGVPPIPKGCYHKKWGYWDIFAKKGALTQSIGMLSKKTENISVFFAKRGGGPGQFQNFLIRKNWGFRIAERGEGGVSEFRSFSEKKKTVFFLGLPLATKHRKLSIKQLRAG